MGTGPAQSVERSWFFTKWFAAIAFLAGGSAVFFMGLRAFLPPSVPEGTASCGTGVLGGLLLMVIGTPTAAISAALAAGAVGWLLDRVLSRK